LGSNGKLVYLNDLTKLLKYNFINLKYNTPNLSDEEADEGLEIMNIMEQEGLEIGKQIELEQETLKKMKENLNSVNS
jgi:RNase P/RNase MRP subunit p30